MVRLRRTAGALLVGVFAVCQVLACTRAASLPILPGDPPGSSPHAAQPILAAVRQLTDAVRARDTAAVRRALAPSARAVSYDYRSDPVRIDVRSVDDLVGAAAASADTIVTRLHTPEVRIDHDVATVWAPYDVFLGSRFSHCGFNGFQLARAANTWRIVSVISTIRSPCAI